ncbi:glycosyltransferase family 39 protein [Chamaesiphon sp. GL140_3_metabinner_50]|uniref:glycosyltransferase family 39 protein n=1 Tax=Chamaesiphon sp. GL140_3_metabinner_50 TaxID=2970812 RepID=UPI0025E84A17|nr:glycosyltransferase family 39 protein [Chamaesiphon sp. GL140_3_metabinner_50]
MKIHHSKSSQSKFSSQAYLLAIVAVLGILFRFGNLDLKVYWQDEALTSLQVAGYSQAEFIKTAFNSEITTPLALQRYQEVNSERGVLDTIKVLTETPEHPPLYFILLRIWANFFGSSIVAYRSFSSLISLLVLPCIYYLCVELFDSPRVGYFGVAITSLSPFFIEYGQEARQYSLWMVAILITSQTLLRAMRLNTWQSWGIYAVALTFSCYTHFFSIFVLAAQGFYVLAIGKFRLNRTFGAFMAAAMAGLLAFTPWIVTFLTHLTEFNRSMSWSYRLYSSPINLVRTWLTLPRLLFFNLDLPRTELFNNYFFSNYYLVAIVTSLFAGYAIYFVIRNTKPKVWLLPLTLIVIPFLILAIPDLIGNGTRSINSRYLTPAYLGIEICVAYLLATRTMLAVNRKIWQIGFATLLAISTLASVINLTINYSFAKDKAIVVVANSIDPSPQSLVIANPYDYNPMKVLALSRRLHSGVKIQLLPEAETPTIPNGFKNYYFYSPQIADTWEQFLTNSAFESVKISKDNNEKLWIYRKK